MRLLAALSKPRRQRICPAGRVFHVLDRAADDVREAGGLRRLEENTEVFVPSRL